MKSSTGRWVSGYDFFDREPELVLRDVRDGLVSRPVARDIYGVVIADDGRSLDLPATKHHRTHLRQSQTEPATAHS